MCAKVVDKKEKKDQILEAALQVFAKKGFAKATINEIAAASGIGKGTVYEYFSNKEEIVDQSFGFFIRHFEIGFQEILIQPVPGREKIVRILDVFISAIDSHSLDLMELMFDYWSEGIKNRESRGLLFNEMNRFYRSYREIFADIIIEGMQDGSFKKNINPRSVSAMIVGTLDGILLQWILDKKNIDLQDIGRTISHTVLNGIATEKE